MPLVGKKVLLRALEQRDLDPLWEAYKDFDLELTTSGDSPPVSDRQVHAFWSKRIDDPAPEMRYFVIEPLPDQPFAGQFAGMCNLYDVDMRNRHAELAIWLAARDIRGLGFGTDAIRALLPYAFEVVRLDKVHLGVYDFNEGGVRSYERVGFRYEGRLRQQIYYEGRYWDEWPMRILRSEWDAIRQAPMDGLRPFHPDDQTAAVDLLQQIYAIQTNAAARTILRKWWRQIDRDVFSYQVNGALVGLITLSNYDPTTESNDESARRVLDQAVADTQRESLRQAIQAAGFAPM